MNPKFLNDKYFEKFLKDRIHKVVAAINLCKSIAINRPEFELERINLDSVLRIRSAIPSIVFPAAIIDAVSKNPKRSLNEIYTDVIDYLIEFRAHMAGSCYDCWENIYNIDEYSFILKKQIWKKATKDKTKHFFCVGCLEKRLNRKLKSKDFDWKVPLNNWPDLRSERLMNRMELF